MQQTVAATITQLMERMKDAFWARSVWEQLEEDEQICLFEALAPGDRSRGVPVERLRKRAKRSPDVCDVAIARLRDHSKMGAGLKRCVVRDILQWASSHTERELTARWEVTC